MCLYFDFQHYLQTPTKTKKPTSYLVGFVFQFAKIIQLPFQLRDKRKPVSYLCPIFRI